MDISNMTRYLCFVGFVAARDCTPEEVFQRWLAGESVGTTWEVGISRPYTPHPCDATNQARNALFADLVQRHREGRK